MIIDARRIAPGERVTADLCIVGAGAAGITIARELAGTGTRVVVLVGGGRRERPRDRDLYRGSAAADAPHEPLEENRRRGWGGSTVLWGGRCIPLDPIDFEPRPYVPFSGWPFGYDELLAYYERANAVCEAGPFRYDAADALPGAPAELVAGFDGPDVVSTHLERWSPPTNFARRYGPELRRAANVRVLMHAHALAVQVAPDGGHVEGIRAACTPGREFGVAAHRYVLAAGGLENPRLLLASTDVDPMGVGNLHDNVGRYYMAHLMGVVARVEVPDRERRVAFAFDRDRDGVYVRRRFWATAPAQRAASMGNAVGFFYRPDIANAGHRDPLFSSTYLAKTYVAALRSRGPVGGWRLLRDDRAARRDHWEVVVRGLPRLVPDAVRLGRERWLAPRRLPMVLGSPRGGEYALFFQTEHAPNPDSRVALSGERDAFGTPRLDVHVAFTDLDVETVVAFHRLIAGRLAESGTGRLVYEVPDVRAAVREHLAHFNSAAHHLGTTRMASRAEDGVVDADGRVFGVDNLYVAGSSVFPTGGHANPTLTIVALALRLADHLRR